MSLPALQLPWMEYEPDLQWARLPPYDHQKLGVSALLHNPYFALFDEMGAGKTKQVIDAACLMFQMGLIDRLIIIAPHSVKSVWYDPELGELAKHLWNNVRAQVTEYRSRKRQWHWNEKQTGPMLKIIISNYEFVRREERMFELLGYCSPKALLVLDESSAVKNHRAAQTKACLKFRKKCGRVVLLNGTPIANHPGDMFSQGNIMSPRILDCRSFLYFRARYAIMGGWQQKQIVGWKDLEDLQQRFAPYVLRRLKIDCLDLPEKLPPVVYTVALTEETWAIYKQMRDEMVAWLSDTNVSIAQQAITKMLRLAQICAGFLGGLEAGALDEEAGAVGDRPTWLGPEPEALPLGAMAGPPTASPSGLVGAVQEVGREKLDFWLDWFAERLYEDPNFKLITWARFRPELERMVRESSLKFPEVQTGAIYGGQTKDRWKTVNGQQVLVQEGEQNRALRLLNPVTAPKGPVNVVGTKSTGSMGHNLTAAHNMFYITDDHNLKDYLQSQDRVHRPGQIHNVNYYHLLATGPKGQKTVDHLIYKARQNKEDLATWTTSAWVHALMEE